MLSFDHRQSGYHSLFLGAENILCLRHTSQSFNSFRADHLIYDPCSGQIDTHAAQTVERPAHPTSNPAGHQLGCASVIKPAIPDPPFFRRLYWFCPFVFIRLYHSGGPRSPRGAPPSLIMSFSMPLTFPERSMHILINHHLEKHLGIAGQSTG